MIVISVIFVFIVVMSRLQLNHIMDTLTDAIAFNGGVFPKSNASVRPLPSRLTLQSDVITEETQFSIRFLQYGLAMKAGL